VQNANAYAEGLSEVLRTANARRAAKPDTEEDMKFELGPDLALMMYKAGARAPDAMNPDAWFFDVSSMQQPGHRRVAAALLNDYFHNVELYPQWRTYLRGHHPRTLVLWGKGDPIFLVAGAEAYKRDLPEAEVVYLDTGHFALEEQSAAIAQAISRFFPR
jgi:pimeloyl-ACP methyl ester carboxylesterase